MINFLNDIKKICILGGGTAGWLAALQMRHLFSSNVEIKVISSPEIPVVGVGEGGILNFLLALNNLNISLNEFINETDAVYKLGFAYEGWRDGSKDDIFYHMFTSFAKDEELRGFYPRLSALVNQNIPLSQFCDSVGLREKNTTQDEITKILIAQKNYNFLFSLHFDSYKVGQYLKKVALSRQIFHHEGIVQDILLDSETNYAKALNIDGKIEECDFLIDASGFSRLAIGKKLQTDWISFQDRLVMNTAIPFYLKHSTENPDLVTRATAMSSGWVWQIPLKERIGAGYVFDDRFINTEQAVNEVEQWLGHSIEPHKIIKFEAGYFKKIWQGNILAVGLSSGFVEPLEATSIGQLIAQLQLFEDLVRETHGLVSDYIIDFYNQENEHAWLGIADFIRMHYDTGRNDTPFWRAAKNLPVSNKYAQLKHIWQYRTPRNYDLLDYKMNVYQHFTVYSWLAIAQAVGLIKPQATMSELMMLPDQQKQVLDTFIQQIKEKMS